MNDFIKLVDNVLEEQGFKKQNLFENNIISRNTFFKYKQRFPSLKTAINVANYLKVSLDYLFEYSTENKFKEYSLDNINFYDNLIRLIKSKNISARQFCKDLGCSICNVGRWNGYVLPSLQTLIEITKYFECSLDDLIL